MRKSTSKRGAKKSAAKKQGRKSTASKPKAAAKPRQEVPGTPTGLSVVLAGLSPNTRYSTRSGMRDEDLFDRPVIWLEDSLPRQADKPYKLQVVNLDRKGDAQEISAALKGQYNTQGNRVLRTSGRETKTLGYVLNVDVDQSVITNRQGTPDDFKRFVSYVRRTVSRVTKQKAALRLKATSPLCKPVTRSKRKGASRATDKTRRVMCSAISRSCVGRLPSDMKLQDLVELLLAYGAKPSDLLTEYENARGVKKTKLKTQKQLLGILGHYQRRNATSEKCSEFKHKTARKQITDVQLKRLVESASSNREALRAEGKVLANIARSEGKDLSDILEELRGKKKQEFLAEKRGRNEGKTSGKKSAGRKSTGKKAASKAASTRSTRSTRRSAAYASNTDKLAKLKNLIQRYQMESRKEQNMQRLQQLVRRYKSTA